MDINLDAHRAAQDRSGRPHALTVDGREFLLTGRLPMRVQLLIAEADEARTHEDFRTILRNTEKAYRAILVNPDEVDDLMDRVELEELAEVLKGFYPETRGASSAPSLPNGSNAKPTSPASTASTSPPLATAMTPST